MSVLHRRKNRLYPGSPRTVAPPSPRSSPPRARVLRCCRAPPRHAPLHLKPAPVVLRRPLTSTTASPQHQILLGGASASRPLRLRSSLVSIPLPHLTGARRAAYHRAAAVRRSHPSYAPWKVAQTRDLRIVLSFNLPMLNLLSESVYFLTSICCLLTSCKLVEVI